MKRSLVSPKILYPILTTIDSIWKFALLRTWPLRVNSGLTGCPRLCIEIINCVLIVVLTICERTKSKSDGNEFKSMFCGNGCSQELPTSSRS